MTGAPSTDAMSLERLDELLEFCMPSSKLESDELCDEERDLIKALIHYKRLRAPEPRADHIAGAGKMVAPEPCGDERGDLAAELLADDALLMAAISLYVRETPAGGPWSQLGRRTKLRYIREAQAAQPHEPGAKPIDKDAVEWVVNDIAELGVKIGNQFFFLYKGYSLVYEDAKHDDGSQMRWRPVFKREFGECCHPVNYEDLRKCGHQHLIGTVDPGDSDEWQDLPPSPTTKEEKQ